MPQDEDSDSSSSDSSSEYTSDGVDDDPSTTTPSLTHTLTPSLETQYINAMVAKITAENEKNHPERSAQSVWQMLYGDMQNYDATSSDEGESSSDDEVSSDGDSDSGEKKLTWDDITHTHTHTHTQQSEEESDDLLDLKKSLPEFIMDPRELKTETKRKKKILVKPKSNDTSTTPQDKSSEGEGTSGSIHTTTQPLYAHEEESEGVEVEVEESEAEEQERLVRENQERIAKEKADAALEWLALHTWLVEFRLKHNMTILDFLEYAEAERDMTHSWQVKQLLSKCAHKFNPSESHSTWGGRTRKLLKKTKMDAESGQISHKKYMQLRLLRYRAKEYAPDNELQYTLRMGYESPEDDEAEVTIASNMFDDLESMVQEESLEENNEQIELSLMAEEDDNKLNEKYTPVHEDVVGMRSTFQYESGSDISDSDDSYGDTDSSSGDEFFWVGGAEGHNMRKEQRKILREDFNVLHEIFDSLEEQKFKREVRERKEREAKEEAERCPTDIAGKVAWRLKQFEKSKSMQEAEDEARRVEQLVAQQAEKERRKRIRKSNKEKKARAMAVLRALKPDTLFV